MGEEFKYRDMCNNHCNWILKKVNVLCIHLINRKMCTRLKSGYHFRTFKITHVFLCFFFFLYFPNFFLSSDFAISHWELITKTFCLICDLFKWQWPYWLHYAWFSALSKSFLLWCSTRSWQRNLKSHLEHI